ncbi:hypothetical protein V8B97DRAFT_665621 [Scleroderma yunnanense]
MVHEKDGAIFANSPVSLLLNGETTPTSFYVLRSFTPFTKSQVYLVRPDACTAFPTQLILKVYDPRFSNGRLERKNFPWSLHVESQATQMRAQDDSWEDTPLHDLWTQVMLCEEHLEPWLWEHYLFRWQWRSFKAEVEAYHRLAQLQGRGIPKFYGYGKLLLTPSGSRAIDPPAVLVEYIPGVTLSNINSKRLFPCLYQPLIPTVASFEKCGVLHRDICNPTNIMFTPREAPQRAVIIDFGCSLTRDIRKSDKEWAEDVDEADDIASLRLTLQRKLRFKLDVREFTVNAASFSTTDPRELGQDKTEAVDFTDDTEAPRLSLERKITAELDDGLIGDG